MEEWVPSWLAKRANIGKYVEHPNQKSSKVLSTSQSYRILSQHFKAVTFFFCNKCLVSSKLPTNHIAERAALLDFPNRFCFIFIYFHSSLIDCLALAGQETTKKNTNLPLTIIMYITHCWREWRSKRAGATLSLVSSTPSYLVPSSFQLYWE